MKRPEWVSVRFDSEADDFNIANTDFRIYAYGHGSKSDDGNTIWPTRFSLEMSKSKTVATIEISGQIFKEVPVKNIYYSPKNEWSRA